MTDLITGAGERKIRSYTPITGLSTCTPVAVNPTNDEFTKITGRVRKAILVVLSVY